MSIRNVLAAVLLGLGATYAYAAPPTAAPRDAVLSPERGIFVDYVWGDVARDPLLAKHLDELFSLSYVSGVAVYLPWADVQPSVDAYDWSVFDALVKAAAAHHKYAALGLCAASFSPGWVKDRVSTFTFTHPNPHVGVQTAPVPWDPAYQKYEEDVVAHMARRYDGNPSVAYVETTGPSTLFGVETNWPMKRGSISPADLAKLAFTPEKYVAAWKEMTLTYYRQFHRTQLGLALNNKFGIDDISDAEGTRIARQIRDFAIAQYPRNGTRLAVRLLGLSAGEASRLVNGPCNAGGTLSPYMTLADDVRSQADVQFQTAGVLRLAGYTPQQFARALQIGESCGASVIEVTSADAWVRGTDQPYLPFRSALVEAQAALLKR